MKHWVFDLDGTLVDSFSHYFDAMAEIFARRGARFTHEHRYAALTEPLGELFGRELGNGQIAGAFSELQARSNSDAEKIRPFSGMRDLLLSLEASGRPVAVWTNRDRESAHLILEHSGLSRHAQIVVTGSCVSQKKPHPEGLLRIVRHFGCHPSEVVMIGDHEHDVSAARSIGATAVRASWHAYWEVAACEIADQQFHDVTDFFHWTRRHLPPGNPTSASPSTTTP